MEILPPFAHTPDKKAKRNDLADSLENFKFDYASSFSFYNSIDVPSGRDQLAWPDLLTAPMSDESSIDQLPFYSFSTPQAVTTATAATAATASSLSSSWSSSSEQETDSAHKRIEELKSKERAYRQTLQKLYDDYHPGEVLGEVQQVEESVRDELSSIDSILEQSVLKVEDLFCALSLKDKYRSVLHHCSILESEELYHMDESSASAEDLVSLEWIEQPLGKSYKNKNRARASKKKKKGHVSMTAQLVCAPGVSFVPSSAVTASFFQVDDEDVKLTKPKSRKRAVPTMSLPRGGGDYSEEQRNEEPSDVQIQNAEERLSNGRVSFDFRFPAGTRNKPCLIRLRVKGVVTMPDGVRMPMELMSRPTHSLIITTNESQFETSELKLLLMELFAGGAASCSWPSFVNALSVRWMRVTRQELESSIACVSSRALTQEELQFVASFFRDAPKTVKRDEVIAFYSFFGKATHHFRHNLAFRGLLLDGLVWGLAGKAQAEAALQKSGCPAGTFLVRTSESAPGCFCVSWKSEQGSVQHALLDGKLLAPPMSALAEYLLSKRFLSFVLLNSSSSAVVVRRKEELLRPLLSGAAAPVHLEPANAGYLDLDIL